MVNETQVAPALALLDELDTPENAGRASHSLRLVLNIQGKGSRAALANAVEVSPQSISNWADSDSVARFSPLNVYKVALALTAHLEDSGLTLELFHAFYSEKAPAAANWLWEHANPEG